MNNPSATEKNSILIGLILFMALYAWLAVKLPMPALPYLPRIFHTTAGALKISITLNLVAFSISQILWGPLSDRYGRRHIVLISLIMAAIGAAIAMIATNIYMYIIGRFIEGFAVGSAAPIGRALMADTLEKIKMAKVYAWFAIMAILPPAIGPIIGGYILVWLGWRYIFAFLILVTIIYFLFCLKWLPETNKNRLTVLRFSYVMEAIYELARSSVFWRYILIYALINGYMIAYYAAMPFWYVVQFHVGDQHYGWLALLPIASYVLGSQLTNYLLKYWTLDKLLLSGIWIIVLVSILLVLLTIFNHPSLIMLNSLMTVFSFASGIVTPMTNASVMDAFRDKVTILSAVMSGIRVLAAAILTLFSTNILFHTYGPLALYTSIIAVLTVISFYFLSNRKQKI